MYILHFEAPTLEYCNGEWSGVIPNWKVRLGSATFILAPSEQGQVLSDLNVISGLPDNCAQLGIFPEQIVNWKWLPITLNQNKIQGEKLRVLNGFAYTGGSTMAALSVDDVEVGKIHNESMWLAIIFVHFVQVVHLDASKSAVQWAMRNANASDMIHKPVKWIVDDCMTFVDREVLAINLFASLLRPGRDPHTTVTHSILHIQTSMSLVVLHNVQTIEIIQ